MIIIRSWYRFNQRTRRCTGCAWYAFGAARFRYAWQNRRALGWIGGPFIMQKRKFAFLRIIQGREFINEGDDVHDAASRKIYERPFDAVHGKSVPDAVTAFLIEYHCLDAGLAEDYLTHSTIKGKDRAWLLYAPCPCG